MHLVLYQRESGGVATALTIRCTATPAGVLCLAIEPVLPWSNVLLDRTLRIETRR